MVTGLQRKWWFLKPLKKAYTSDRFWSLIFQIVSFCKTSILIATQKMHHVPANINVFEIQRKAKYHPCSLKFNLPICAVRKICASLPEFENFTESDLLSNTKNVHWSAAKMVIFKIIKKKSIPVTTFEVYRFSLWFYKNSIRWSLPEFTRVCALAYALTSLSVRPQNPCVLSICDERAFVPKTP